MKGFGKLVGLCYFFSLFSLLIGIIQKIGGLRFSWLGFPAYPLTFLRFSSYSLLFAIALSLTHLALNSEKKK